jgi:mannose-6-phosphate isomerase
MDVFTHKDHPNDNHFPEDWLASTTVANNGAHQQTPMDGLSKIKLSNKSAVKFFKDILSENPSQSLGLEHFNEKDGIGVLCKYLDSAVRLPIQCHPDIPFARKYYNSDHGKSESWFILGTRVIDGQEPYILMGFKENTDPDSFKKAVKDQDVPFMEQCLHKVKVVPGEMYFIPGRMPHAIGPGIFLLEVQEPTDWVVQPEEFIGDTQLSYSDMWGPLTPEIGLECFDYQSRDTLENILKKVKLVGHNVKNLGGGYVEKIIDKDITPCFRVDQLVINSEVKLNYDAPWYIAVVAEGACEIKSQAGIDNAKQGDCFFVSNKISELNFKALDKNARLYLITKGQ